MNSNEDQKLIIKYLYILKKKQINCLKNKTDTIYNVLEKIFDSKIHSNIQYKISTHLKTNEDGERCKINRELMTIEISIIFNNIESSFYYFYKKYNLNDNKSSDSLYYYLNNKIEKNDLSFCGLEKLYEKYGVYRIPTVLDYLTDIENIKYVFPDYQKILLKEKLEKELEQKPIISKRGKI